MKDTLKEDLKKFIKNLITAGKHPEGINVINFPNSTAKLAYKVFFILSTQNKVKVEINGHKYDLLKSAYFYIAQLLVHAYALEVSAIGDDWGIIYTGLSHNIGLLTDIYKKLTGGNSPSIEILTGINNVILKEIDSIPGDSLIDWAKKVINYIDYPIPSIEIEAVGVIFSVRKNALREYESRLIYFDNMEV